ncbi:MAG: ABC transporter ATP-binding protein [Nitrososphaerales archaeon]
MTNPSLEAVNLSKVYGSFTALSNLNLKIEGAKCVGFLGPNGAGKTTTLKIFTDLIRPSSGHAFINGANVHTHKKQALGSVGTVIETPEMYPSSTPRLALNVIAEMRGVPHAERKKKIEEVVAEVGMSEWIDKRVGKFSKGMKQRICIASALLSDPTIVLLDEPTTGLDPRGMSEVRDIVKTLKKKDRLIFMSSHILSEVEDVCDEVAMIDHGKLLVYDTLANVTAKFSGGANIIEVGLSRPIDAATVQNRIAKISGVVSAQMKDSTNLIIKSGEGASVQESILGDLVGMRIGVIRFSPASSALEESYLNLIKDTL